MAVLDVQLHRGSLSIGRSTSYERTPRGLLSALVGMAVCMRRESWRPGECFVGSVRRPSMDRLRPLVKGSATRWASAEPRGAAGVHGAELIVVQPGTALRSEHPVDDSLVVVLEGCGDLRVGAVSHFLEPGFAAALPAGCARSIDARGRPLRLLVCSASRPPVGAAPSGS